MKIIPEIDEMRRRWFPSHTHPYRTLENAVESRLQGHETVLGIGSGRHAPNLVRLIGKAERLIGVDPVDLATDAPAGVELHQASANNMRMVQDESIDLAYSRSTFEHLEDPEGALREIARVLKPGGRVFILTPNLFDYASLIAMVVPNCWHPKIVAAVEGRDMADTFPTFFRANTRRAFSRLAQTVDLEVERFEYCGQYPSYLSFSRILFWFGSQYERAIRSFRSTQFLRGWIFCVLRKSSTQEFGSTPATE
jgi:SAM-dependent methyltransferase